MLDQPIPQELKFINQFIQRSKELQDQEPSISYYCLCYSVKLSINQGFKEQESRDYISNLFDILEQTKQSLSDNEAITSELTGFAYVENFALKVFTAADNQERQGNFTIKTVRNFMAAANFLEILKYFDKELDNDVVEKLKYAKFKAAEIAKMIKEGRVPPKVDNDGLKSPNSQTGEIDNANDNNTDNQFNDIQSPSIQDNHPIDRLPSPPINQHNINETSYPFPPIPPNFQSSSNINENDYSNLPNPPNHPVIPPVNSINNENGFDLPSIPQHQPSAPQSPNQYHQPSAPNHPHSAPPSNNPYNMSHLHNSLPSSAPVKMLDPKLLTQAEKCCRFAISSLQYDDLDEALKQLDKARNFIVQMKHQQ